jgi:hypothetical protein
MLYYNLHTWITVTGYRIHIYHLPLQISEVLIYFLGVNMFRHN